VCVGLCVHTHKFVRVHAHFNFALLRKFYGVFKKKSFVETCHHMPLSLPPPPWPQLFDQPPIPNRLPRSQFLSDSDRSSGKIYLPPLTNASVTCKSPSSRRRLLEIDHRTKSTLILFLCYPQNKSPLPKSILVRFGLGKWQNISTVPDERTGHLRIAVVASSTPRN
jgi:hypothetical protein